MLVDVKEGRRWESEIRNPKHEIQNEFQGPKAKTTKTAVGDSAARLAASSRAAALARMGS
jgi:hypothetical protein